jgi:hypothetical protein
MEILQVAIKNNSKNKAGNYYEAPEKRDNGSFNNKREMASF